jgi:hypothetical protein
MWFDFPHKLNLKLSSTQNQFMHFKYEVIFFLILTEFDQFLLAQLLHVDQQTNTTTNTANTFLCRKTTNKGTLILNFARAVWTRKLLCSVTKSWIRDRVPCWPLHEWNTWQVRCYDSGTDESSAVGHAAYTASSELIHQSDTKQHDDC